MAERRRARGGRNIDGIIYIVSRAIVLSVDSIFELTSGFLRFPLYALSFPPPLLISILFTLALDGLTSVSSRNFKSFRFTLSVRRYRSCKIDMLYAVPESVGKQTAVTIEPRRISTHSSFSFLFPLRLSLSSSGSVYVPLDPS